MTESRIRAALGAALMLWAAGDVAYAQPPASAEIEALNQRFDAQLWSEAVAEPDVFELSRRMQLVIVGDEAALSLATHATLSHGEATVADLSERMVVESAQFARLELGEIVYGPPPPRPNNGGEGPGAFPVSVHYFEVGCLSARPCVWSQGGYQRDDAVVSWEGGLAPMVFWAPTREEAEALRADVVRLTAALATMTTDPRPAPGAELGAINRRLADLFSWSAHLTPPAGMNVTSQLRLTIDGEAWALELSKGVFLRQGNDIVADLIEISRIPSDGFGRLEIGEVTAGEPRVQLFGYDENDVYDFPLAMFYFEVGCLSSEACAWSEGGLRFERESAAWRGGPSAMVFWAPTRESAEALRAELAAVVEALQREWRAAP